MLSESIVVKIKITCLIFVILFVLYSLVYKQYEANKKECVTRNYFLKGVIIYVSGRTGYRYLQIDNFDEPISVNPSTLIFRKGFNELHFFEIGDSILKSANSDEITVKKGDSIVRFQISCSD
jgi:hypothetical protein